MHSNRFDQKETNLDIGSVHNYYEHLVIALLLKTQAEHGISASDIPDVACVALNRLPPRYIRHDVDMAFNLSPDEYREIENNVEEAVAEAITFVKRRTRSESV